MGWERMRVSKAKGGMGFKDLTIFNKALLAKQVWRIMQNPSSLVTRIMQAKYFSRKKVFEAGLGTRPSLAWRSLLSLKEILIQGSIWRGNGNDIRILGDCWLQKPTSFSVQTPKSLLMENMRVSELIDQDMKYWRREFIEQNFLQADVISILNIPLSPFLRKDRLIWRCMKNGEFSMKSAYHLRLECSSL